ncbi:9932_t:CDS:2, partial [Funneliformis caledonium]
MEIKLVKSIAKADLWSELVLFIKKELAILSEEEDLELYEKKYPKPKPLSKEVQYFQKKEKLEIKAGLRITEALNFDLSLEHRENHKFLEQVKKEMNLPNNVELSPHTLRRCFATYQAISGMPLPVLQKVLGHSKVSTTALYIRDGDLSNLPKLASNSAIQDLKQQVNHYQTLYQKR